jgi:hypothetical protein
MLRTSFTRAPRPYPQWKMGERLLASALYARLYPDDRFLAQATPALGRYVAALERSVGSNGLLAPERYSSDIPDSIYGLHGQAVVWQGLRELAAEWERHGSSALAARARALAARLGTGLQRAIRRSQHRLSDGSLFVPMRLLDDEQPYGSVVEARSGSYWNLVAPYALASGFFAPHGARAIGVLRYMLLHGSRLLGLVRAGAYRLAGSDPSVSGTDEVYGANVARFLADNDQADQLVLSLYGTLAAALTPGTYVAGEAASVTPLRGALYRTMYLPPNNAGAATFLETLHSMLVHETRGREGAPHGLELAFSTPRAWLEDGKSIVVTAAPTSFGAVSYSITRVANTANITVSPPTAPAPATLRLRLRLPRGESVSSVELAGRSIPYDAVSGTIDLSGRHGTLGLTATLVRRHVR